MDEGENGEVLAVEASERRSAPRLAVAGVATLFLVTHGSSVSCRVVDLSVGGCLVETEKRFAAGILLRVEVAFKVKGIAFRFNGVTQWTDGRQRVGIRFVEVTSRRSDALVELLREVEQENAEKAGEKAATLEELAVKEVAVSGAGLQPACSIHSISGRPVAESAAGEAIDSVADRSSLRGETASFPAKKTAETALPEVEGTAEVQRHVKPAQLERRAQSRYEVDTSAVIHLINIGSRLPARILDLSLGGCCIRTDERFPVGIYTRVEAEFCYGGLPFRLGGVIQSIHDRRQVGIRFLDISDRKRALVAQLIEEMEEMRVRQRVVARVDSAGEEMSA